MDENGTVGGMVCDYGPAFQEFRAVERAIEQLVIDGRAKKDSLSPEQREAADDEARAFYRKVYEHFRDALAMKAHDLPQGDNIKPAIVKILRSHMTHGWDEAASEIAALVRPMSRSEQIMDTIDPAWADAGEIRSPIGDDHD